MPVKEHKGYTTYISYSFYDRIYFKFDAETEKLHIDFAKLLATASILHE